MSPWIQALVLALVLNGAAAAATSEPAKPAAPAKDEKAVHSTKGEVAKADENRKKPLQRCDELKDKAQLDCLQKARARIVEARNQREGKGEKK